MADAKKYSGLSRKAVKIPAYSVATVEYNDTIPNYYRVQNEGTVKLFCGTSHIPTQNSFDFAVNKQSVKMYAEPFRSNNLYIYNPSGSEVSVVVVSFYAEFDPATLALADLELDMSGVSLETSTVITGFSSALPAGSNKIGKVEVSNFPTDPATNEGVTYVGERVEYGNTLIAYLSKEYEKILNGTATSGGVSLTADSGYRLCEVCFLSNDGSADLTVNFDYEGAMQSITVKAGEVLNNCRCYCDSIKVSGNNIPFRLFAVERKKV